MQQGAAPSTTVACLGQLQCPGRVGLLPSGSCRPGRQGPAAHHPRAGEPLGTAGVRPRTPGIPANWRCCARRSPPAWLSSRASSAPAARARVVLDEGGGGGKVLAAASAGCGRALLAAATRTLTARSRVLRCVELQPGSDAVALRSVAAGRLMRGQWPGAGRAGPSSVAGRRRDVARLEVARQQGGSIPGQGGLYPFQQARTRCCRLTGVTSQNGAAGRLRADGFEQSIGRACKQGAVASRQVQAFW